MSMSEPEVAGKAYALINSGLNRGVWADSQLELEIARRLMAHFDRQLLAAEKAKAEPPARDFELAAGVLDHAQEVFIQDNWRLISLKNIKAAGASQPGISNVLAAAKRLQARPELMAWLPYVRDMQLEQISVHRGRLERADAALETLNDYAREIRAAN